MATVRRQFDNLVEKIFFLMRREQYYATAHTFAKKGIQQAAGSLAPAFLTLRRT